MDDLSRRTLLRGAGVAAAAVPLSTLLADPAFAAPARALTRSSFAPRVGSTFSVRGRLGAGTFKLVAVENLPSSRKGDEKRFALQFQQVKGRGPGQGTWAFQHQQLGRFALFVVPVGRKRGAYEAVFNAR
jgi:hypothetical protein